VRVTRLDAAGARARELLWCIREVSVEQRLRERLADLEGARERYERELQVEMAAILRLRDAARDHERASLRAMLDAAVARAAAGEPGRALEELIASLRELLNAAPPLPAAGANGHAPSDERTATRREDTIVPLRASGAGAGSRSA
jgi:hypothetical protein